MAHVLRWSLQVPYVDIPTRKPYTLRLAWVKGLGVKGLGFKGLGFRA